MSDESARASVRVDTQTHPRSRAEVEAVRGSVEILVIGDFSGRGASAPSPDEPLGERRAFRVDSLDDALARLRPVVELGPDADTALAFEALDDFHPDRLVPRVPPLKELVASLSREGRAPDATRDDPVSARDPVDGPSDSPEPPGDPPEGLLDAIVAEEEDTPSRPRPEGLSELRSWVRDMVGPHLERQLVSDEQRSREQLEAEAAAVLGAVLHHPAVHALERIWLSLLHLLRVVTATPEVRLHLLDLSLEEVESLAMSGDPTESALHRTLSESLPESVAAGRPGLVVGGYDFGASPSDVRLLNRMSIAAHVLGARFVAAAAPALLGLESFDGDMSLDPGGEPGPAWSAFRDTEAAGSTALLAPGFLLRAPYGARTEPCQTLAFEEVENGGVGRYVWGNPAFLGTAVLVEQLGRGDRRPDPTSPRELTGRPIHTTPSGDVRAHPVQALWSTDSARRVMELGVNPILGYRSEARLLVPPIRSAARSGGLIVHR